MSPPRPTTVYQADTWREMSEDARQAIKKWVIANGISPRDLHISEPITVQEGRIHYWKMTWEGPGRVKAMRNDQGVLCPVVEEVITDLLVPPPDITALGKKPGAC